LIYDFGDYCWTLSTFKQWNKIKSGLYWYFNIWYIIFYYQDPGLINCCYRCDLRGTPLIIKYPPPRYNFNYSFLNFYVSWFWHLDVQTRTGTLHTHTTHISYEIRDLKTIIWDILYQTLRINFKSTMPVWSTYIYIIVILYNRRVCTCVNSF